MAIPEFALAHFAAAATLANAAGEAAVGIWSEVSPAAIAASWAALVPEAQTVTAGAQLAAAKLAAPYLVEAAAFADAVDPAALQVVARAFAGVASDGRALDTLLYQPAIASLLAVREGADTRIALATGRATLQMMVRTQVADAGRSAVQAGLVARRDLDGYTRVAVGRSCARCVILAGKFYRYNTGFDRHPQCDCVHLPCKQAQAAGISQDPMRVYNAMTPQERSAAGWSKADQKAIAEGADLGQVTNIRRKGGLYVADGKQYTHEGTRARGRRGTKRMTPGQISREAGDDREKAIRLLREHGYLYDAAKA